MSDDNKIENKNVLGQESFDFFNLFLGSIILMVIAVVCFLLFWFIVALLPIGGWTAQNLVSDAFNIFCIIMGIVIFGMVASGIGFKWQEYDNQTNCIVNRNLFQQEYDEYIKKLGITERDIEVTLISKHEKYDFKSRIPQYLWVADGILHMFPTAEYYLNNVTSISKPDISELKITTILLDSILYYQETGQLYRHAFVSGGESRFDALTEATVSEPIKTNIVSEDYRVVELTYKNQDGEIESLEFRHDAYEIFKKIMPMKDMRKIKSVKTVQAKTPKKRIPSAKKQLKQLNELKEEGLITEEEYTTRREKILDSIME